MQMNREKLLRSPAILQCRLFCGIDKAEISKALTLLAAHEVKYEKGEMLITAGRPMSHFGLVLSGIVQVCSDDINGNRMIMATVTAGETFAESLCYLGVAESPVYAVASEPATVLWLKTESFTCKSDKLVSKLYDRFVAMLAERTLTMNDRIQVLSKGTLRAKLLTFFSQCEHKNGSKTFTLPFDRESLAVYLGVNRSALSRELARMQREEIIEFYKSSFKIL